MKILIAGGTGFIGRHLIKSLLADGHQVWVLSRNPHKTLAGVQVVYWDGQTTVGWGQLVNEMDTIVNLSGLSLQNWPWTKKKKLCFRNSRVQPGLALAAAIKGASHRPRVFVQISGVNYYGLRGEGLADEDSPPANDFLAQLTVEWEKATDAVEALGVRCVVCRTAVVLAKDAILMWLMSLPVRLYFGGRFGSGEQALPWIHIDDQVGAIRYLIDTPTAVGPYNLIAPQHTSNAEFMRTMSKVLRRPCWFPVPANLMRLALGEISQLILEGRYVQPRRLVEQGYTFRFANLENALRNVFRAL